MKLKMKTNFNKDYLANCKSRQASKLFLEIQFSTLFDFQKLLLSGASPVVPHLPQPVSQPSLDETEKACNFTNKRRATKSAAARTTSATRIVCQSNIKICEKSKKVNKIEIIRFSFSVNR